MTRARLIFITLLAALALLMLPGCDVHEFPRPEGEPQLQLHLHLDTEYDFYTEIYYNLDESDPMRSRSGETMLHYRVKGWRNLPAANRGDASTYGPADFETDYYGNSPAAPDAVINIEEIDPGHWTFIAWADVCDASGESLSHDASDFGNIVVKLDDDGLINNSQEPHAWRGKAEADIDLDCGQHAVMEMEKPHGYFRFITTDIEKFMEDNDLITRYGAPAADISGRNRALDLSDYKIVYYVDGYYPMAFDNFINKPVDARQGCYGIASINNLGDGTANLGGLHALVNGSISSLRVVAQVVHRSADDVGQTMPITVPIVRGKLTIAKGPFLTSKASGGVYVNPEFDGEFNIFIP